MKKIKFNLKSIVKDLRGKRRDESFPNKMHLGLPDFPLV